MSCDMGAAIHLSVCCIYSDINNHLPLNNLPPKTAATYLYYGEVPLYC